jgi:hypothetical protein
MTLAFARAMAPGTPFLLAAVLSGRRRPRHLPWGHRWIRIADRLVAGLPPAAATLPEGDPGLASRLLEQEEFQALVAASKEMLAEPEEVQRRRLIILARQALERALVQDDAGAALFVLEEETQGRDPAATLAEGVRAAQARAAAPVRPGQARERHAGPGYAPGYDPLRALMHRGSARLRADIRAEDALRHTAVAAVEPPPTGVAAIRAAAAKALRLARTAARHARPVPAGQAPQAKPGVTPAGAEPHPARGPRQPRAP